MKGDDKLSESGLRLRHGPVLWAVAALVGVFVGALLTKVVVPELDAAGQPVIKLILVAPFAALLGSIALMPFVSQRVWHRHYPDFAFALGGLVAGYYLAGFKDHGRHDLLHAFLEYYSFIALVGGLYVVSGGILIRTSGRGRPLTNTALLAFGAVLANIVGTTGASVLLIRPFMRLNEGRLKPLHVVMFIFIVSNCGGCLTPIGDPPLYLGYLKGVPFFWTLTYLWQDWLLVVGGLLAVFLVIDTVVERRTGLPAKGLPKVSIEGGTGLVCLMLMIGGVFLDPLLKAQFGITGVPFGATFQVLVAIGAYFMAPRPLLSANEFTFEPVKEVGLLFIGIFLTMIPALGYLAANGAKLGVDTSTAFYWGTGALSGVLDNAPTYLNFLQVAMPEGKPISGATIAELLESAGGTGTLIAISTGAVFFGAMTYIGNGPNFMVRSIAEAAGVKMPSFFGYLGWAVVILLPILALHWLLMIR
jgi:Na+/H+ antiporter NhaD/arsenite permease-like protein